MTYTLGVLLHGMIAASVPSSHCHADASPGWHQALDVDTPRINLIQKTALRVTTTLSDDTPDKSSEQNARLPIVLPQSNRTSTFQSLLRQSGASRWDYELVTFFIGLMVVACMRLISPLKTQLTLLYALVVCEFLWTMRLFYMLEKSEEQKPGAHPSFWLIVWFAPYGVLLTLVLCFQQTWRHLRRMDQGTSPQKHDQAVQIIALPAVYGVMSFSSLVRTAQVASRDARQGDPNMLPNAMIRSETCFQVANLYEAWALYQISILTLEFLKTAISKQTKSDRAEERSEAKGLMVAHSAVQSLTLQGTMFFFVVCAAQSAWSVWLWWAPAAKHQEAQREESILVFLNGAGAITSFLAIYNVYVVDTTFHNQLDQYKPLLKFWSVKIIVSLDFIQFGFLWMFNEMKNTLTMAPQLSDQELKLGYSALICWELLGISILHIFAWDADEDWYNEGK